MRGTGEANYFRYYKRLGVITKLATSYYVERGGYPSFVLIQHHTQHAGIEMDEKPVLAPTPGRMGNG